ncbi:hypothetical protein R3I94_008745 [Phoxinus phoxinus]
MRTHPGKTLTIYDIPNLVVTALPRAATPHLACYYIFEEQDFSPSYVTDRPDPSQVPCALTPHCNTDPYSQSLFEGGLLPEYPAGSTRDTRLVSAIPDHPAVCLAVPPEEGRRGMLEVNGDPHRLSGEGSSGGGATEEDPEEAACSKEKAPHTSHSKHCTHKHCTHSFLGQG